MKRYILFIVFALSLLLLVSCSADVDDGMIGGDTEEGTTDDVQHSYNCAFEQKGDEQRISVSWNKNANIKRVDIAVKHGDMTVSDITIRGEVLSRGYAEVDAFYGRHEVSVTVVGTDGRIENKTEDISIVCDEYVIAPISGSMPQLYFTLYMNEITNNYTTPAFVWLTRPGSWNWDRLPENVYTVPTVDVREALQHDNYNRMIEATDAYIEELYSIDSDAKFKLYINDYNLYLYPKLMAANGIPEENYKVVLLSDGGSSYSEFNRAFNSDDENFDADAKYADMADKLDALLYEVREVKDYNWIYDFTVDTNEIRQYAYVAAKEKDNVEWWVLRPRADQTLYSPDKEFLDSVMADVVTDPEDAEDPVIVERNFATPLSLMTDEQRAALKEFYNFNDEMFSEAISQKKKVMMFLGSWADEYSEPDFEAYVKLMKKYFGDEFVYYYKGHPSTPTSNHPEKAAQLETCGLIDVESSINAELILFFYPDIYMCGYNSSTFMSANKDEMACAIFGMRAKDCMEDYKGRVGLFVSKITDFTEFPECEGNLHEYFLIEYNRIESKYEYSVYDATEDVIFGGPLRT